MTAARGSVSNVTLYSAGKPDSTSILSQIALNHEYIAQARDSKYHVLNLRDPWPRCLDPFHQSQGILVRLSEVDGDL